LIIAALLLAHVELVYFEIEANLKKLNRIISLKHLSQPLGPHGNAVID
jgi:hypothetical protein